MNSLSLVNRLSRGVATSGMQGSHGPSTSVSEPNKVYQFQLNIRVILLFMGVQKLHRPEISQFLLCMLQFLNS